MQIHVLVFCKWRWWSRHFNRISFTSFYARCRYTQITFWSRSFTSENSVNRYVQCCVIAEVILSIVYVHTRPCVFHRRPVAFSGREGLPPTLPLQSSRPPQLPPDLCPIAVACQQLTDKISGLKWFLIKHNIILFTDNTVITSTTYNYDYITELNNH